MVLKSMKNWLPLHVCLNNSITRPSFKHLRVVFYEVAKYVKRVFTFSRWPLMPELKIKNANWRWSEPTCQCLRDLQWNKLQGMTCYAFWGMKYFLVNYFLVMNFGQATSDGRTDGRTDGQTAMHMSPLCISTGVLKNCHICWVFLFLFLDTFNFSSDTSDYRSLFKCKHTFGILGHLVKKMQLRFLKDGITT